MIAKKGNTAVTFITWLAAFAMTTAVAAMFVIISVFSGLEELNKEFVANLHADLSISSKSGKVLKGMDKVEAILKKNPQIAHYSKTIEEKILITYGNANEIAYLRAVDSAYTSINPIDKEVFFGKYPNFQYSNEAILEYSLDNRLKIPPATDEFALLYMPKPGVGIIHSEEDLFEKKEVYITGVFNGKDQLNNYLIAPLELGESLLNLPKKSAYRIVIKLKNSDLTDEVKSELEQKLGTDYILKTKQEENAAFWKMINTEKLMIYLIFALVIFITTFNLSGAIIILQLDKKQQAKSLISLGFTFKNLRLTYFYTGLLIVGIGVISGLVLGTLLSVFQLKTGIFRPGGADFPFPIKIEPINYLLVSILALFFGVLVSWIFSKINKEDIGK